MTINIRIYLIAIGLILVISVIWLKASGFVTQPKPVKLSIVQNMAAFALAFCLSIGYVHFFTNFDLYLAVGPAIILAFAIKQVIAKQSRSGS